MNVVFFGDSITQGYWGIEHGWVDRVRKYYSELLFAKDEYHGIYNLGIDGDVVEDIQKRIKTELEARIRPNHKIMPVVAIQIGVNDDTDKEVDLKSEISKYKDRLNATIREIEGLNSEILLVGYPSCDEEKTTPVSWGPHYYTNEKAKAYETAMAEVAKEAGAIFVPVFDEFKKHIDAGEDLLADGLHPNDAGHEVIYNIVMPKLQEILK
jgi:lysophospholipase L1-like esterase